MKTIPPQIFHYRKSSSTILEFGLKFIEPKKRSSEKRESLIILLGTTKVIFLFSSSLLTHFLLHTKNGFIFLSHGVKLNYRLSSPDSFHLAKQISQKAKKKQAKRIIAKVEKNVSIEKSFNFNQNFSCRRSFQCD